MAVNIHVGSVTNAEESSVHFLPCLIEHDGDANVNKYFTTSIRENNNGMKASFRGRPLMGEKMKVPSGYTGVVLKEPHKKFNEEEDRQWKADSTFSSFTYWNLDKAPSSYDKIRCATDWLELAYVVHSPIDKTEEKKE